MHQRIDKKNNFLIYLVFLLFLSTFNNLSINDNKNLFFDIKKIKISGLSNYDNHEIKKNLNYLLLKNIFFLKKEYLTNTLTGNNIIDSFKVQKIYPDSINIKITKTKLLAITSFDNKNYFIGANQKLINYNHSEKKLPYVFGKPDLKEFIDLVKIFNLSKFNFDDLNEIYYFPSGRWDVKNKDNIVLKLPKKDLLSSLNLGYKVINNNNFKSIKIIDLRVLDKLIITNE